ncbi:MAG: hypothetical protein PHY47_00600 [Lachnospiraceae bacterium]|nr:hypothetical protein [Lachnospiraceae bacterium]
MIIPKDLDKRADELLNKLKEKREVTEEELMNIYTEVSQDYEQVKEYCSHEYVAKVQAIILLVATKDK